MKAILISLCLLGTATISFSQGKNQIVFNNSSISENLTGKWQIVAVSPTGTSTYCTGFEVKGPGYGDVYKIDVVPDDAQKNATASKTIVSKISAVNNGQIMFSDAEGQRIVFKIVSFTKNRLVLSDGKVSMDFEKQKL